MIGFHLLPYCTIMILMATMSGCCKHHHEKPEVDVTLLLAFCERENQPQMRSHNDLRHISVCIERDGQRRVYHVADTQIPLKLQPGRYKAYIWAEKCGKCRDASEIPYVSLNSRYITTCEAQAGNANFEVISNAQVVRIQLQKPLAKYCIVTTDADGKDLSGMTAKIRYISFLPTIFNIASFAPCDAATDFSFETRLNGNALIAEDYIFADERESSVNVSIEILDKDNNLVSHTPNLRIPYQIECTTIIKGKFLTSQGSNGGVSLDQEWEGEYEVNFNKL